MKIAVIGAGISGLVAAYMLCDHHDVTVYEAADRIGGHTNTVDVTIGDERHAIDTGFIVFNELNYPNFTRLMRDLGVHSQPTEMSFSVRCGLTGLEYNGDSLNALFSQRRNLLRPRFYGMVRDILRFGREGPALLESMSDDVTVEQFVADGRYGDAFMRNYLVPLGAALWSAPAASFRQFPIRFVADFLHNHRMFQVGGRPTWRTIRGGSKTYLSPLTSKFRDRIRTGTPVCNVRRRSDGVDLTLGDGQQVAVDHVVLGCHADTALAMLADPTSAETELLAAFPYQKNLAVLHTDASVLPRKRRAWASWNYRIGETSDQQATVTYHMNRLQSLTSKHEFCVTLNDEAAIDPAKIITRIPYEHPIYTKGRSAAQARHREVAAANRTSFCGAYWGFGFHEDGVRSGLAVAAAIEQFGAAA